MSGYVIVNADTGEYAARLDLDRIYTNRLTRARYYDTPDEAQGDLCPANEYVVSIDELLKEGFR